MESRPVDPPIDALMEQMAVEARAVAWRHWHSAPYVLEFDELVSLASKGLVEARARWPEYCRKNGYNPELTRYFRAYVLRRMNGAILDYMRSQDWVSRTVRNRARALRDAGQDEGMSERQMAAATGMTRDEVSQTLAAMARRPVGFDPVEHDVRAAVDTESAAVVDDLLAEAVRVMQLQPLPVQLTLTLTFYHGLSVRQAAQVLGLEVGEVAGLQQQGALAVHEAMTQAAKERLWVWAGSRRRRAGCSAIRRRRACR